MKLIVPMLLIVIVALLMFLSTHSFLSTSTSSSSLSSKAAAAATKRRAQRRSNKNGTSSSSILLVNAMARRLPSETRLVMMEKFRVFVSSVRSGDSAGASDHHSSQGDEGEGDGNGCQLRHLSIPVARGQIPKLPERERLDVSYVVAMSNRSRTKHPRRNKNSRKEKKREGTVGDAVRAGDVGAVLVAMHGCSHTAKDFCLPHATQCPGCMGLPEELRIVEEAVARRGIAVIAVSSQNKASHCWNTARFVRKRHLSATDYVRRDAAKRRRMRSKGAFDEVVEASTDDPEKKLDREEVQKELQRQPHQKKKQHGSKSHHSQQQQHRHPGKEPQHEQQSEEATKEDKDKKQHGNKQPRSHKRSHHNQQRSLQQIEVEELEQKKIDDDEGQGGVDANDISHGFNAQSNVDETISTNEWEVGAVNNVDLYAVAKVLEAEGVIPRLVFEYADDGDTAAGKQHKNNENDGTLIFSVSAADNSELGSSSSSSSTAGNNGNDKSSDGVSTIPNTLVPVIGFGASSGGQFMGLLPSIVGDQLVGVVAQVAAPFPALRTSSSKGSAASAAAAVDDPTVYVYSVLSRDKGTWHRAKMIAKKLNNNNKNPSASSSSSSSLFNPKHDRSKVFAQDPLPLNESFFHLRAPHTVTTVEQSSKIYMALEGGGFLDAAGSRTLLKNPRASNWRKAVAPTVVGEIRDTLKADKSAISEEMNVAFGLHELHADRFGEMLDFIIDQHV